MTQCLVAKHTLQSMLVSNLPCSPGRNAYSLNEGQDTLEEEDEEEGHEVERAIGPMNIVDNNSNKSKDEKNERAREPGLPVVLLQFHFLLQNPFTLHTCFNTHHTYNEWEIIISKSNGKPVRAILLTS